MSKGPGRIERVIAETFERRPKETFSGGELAALCYPEAPTIEKKHRVSVLRAADKVMARIGWRAHSMVSHSREKVYYDQREWADDCAAACDYHKRRLAADEAKRAAMRAARGAGLIDAR